eukprot:ctg_1671.g460
MVRISTPSSTSQIRSVPSSDEDTTCAAWLVGQVVTDVTVPSWPARQPQAMRGGVVASAGAAASPSARSCFGCGHEEEGGEPGRDVRVCRERTLTTRRPAGRFGQGKESAAELVGVKGDPAKSKRGKDRSRRDAGVPCEGESDALAQRHLLRIAHGISEESHAESGGDGAEKVVRYQAQGRAEAECVPGVYEGGECQDTRVQQGEGNRDEAARDI